MLLHEHLMFLTNMEIIVTTYLQITKQKLALQVSIIDTCHTESAERK